MGEEKRLVPVWEKELLSVKEAAAVSEGTGRAILDLKISDEKGALI